MCSQDQEGRRHGQQARGEEGGVVGGPERGLGDGDPAGQKIFRVIRKYLLAMLCNVPGAVQLDALQVLAVRVVGVALVPAQVSLRHAADLGRKYEVSLTL